MNRWKYHVWIIFLAISGELFSQPGWLDATFGSSGKVKILKQNASYLVKSVDIQLDGKILLGMTLSDNTGDFFGACRLCENGDRDRSFGFNGFATISAGSSTCQFADGILQPDGKLILAGISYISNHYNFAIARLKVTGKADSTFGGAGYVVIPVGTGNDDARSVAIQEDGKLVVAGTTYNNATQKNDFAVIRLLANGSLDMTFGNNGKVIYSAGNSCYDGCDAVLIQPDGKILLGGGACLNDQNGSALIRLLPNGSPDPAFGSNGIVVGNQGSRILDLALQSDGKILECGYNYENGHNYQTTARYHANGSPDTTFGDYGMVVTAVFSAYSNYALSITEEPDGHILTGGYTQTAGTGLNPLVSFMLISFNTDGSVNENFGDSGIVLTSFTPFEDFGMDFCLDRFNRVVLQDRQFRVFHPIPVLPLPGTIPICIPAYLVH
jgi:uncharacterized delta-60 repeat protein